ncbi:hypothetical protein [Cohnella luojiensis]|uniref:Uncharacterized protein n=1 Tax=Cohnella luojiensis TaxID=652876 RepID=A0A4Y8M2P5_9BACL|nr:hypothetical protein [Cohnella luojiensis]TFE29384.1 hypothetical protein E2980_05135 [Cohnella luojiensis]
MVNCIAGKAALGLLALLFVVGAAFGYAEGKANAAESYSLALTSPPPEEKTQSSFNPSHLYLDNGTNSVVATSGSITITAETSAVQVVDSIGITFYVQKWNGSAWETIGSGSTTGGNQLIRYNNSVNKSVTAGYYYRARTIHWVIENGTYEEGERLSNAVLGQ